MRQHVELMEFLYKYTFEVMGRESEEEMPTKILSLLEGSLPKETTYESSENHMRGDITDAYTTGWNACLQEIRSKME